MRGWFAVLLAGALGICATLPLVMGDASRGQALFRSQGCLACHGLNGGGGKLAPDLGVRGGRGFSPAALAALMWNHAPRMWEMIRKQQLRPPDFGEQQAADLFAYFHAARYFESPEDARRGGQVFTEKGCAFCHGRRGPGPGGAPPVSSWQSAEDPIALVLQLWNHSLKMHHAIAQAKVPYPELAAEDLTALVAHVRRVKRAKLSRPRPGVGSADVGEKLFAEKLCAACHKGDSDLRSRRTRFSILDVAVSLWNRGPMMATTHPALSYDEMRHLLSYLGAVQYSEEAGNIDRGQEVFRKKRCAACHLEPASGAPDLSGQAGSFSSHQMVAALWKHGPAMLERMNREKIPWPQFTAAEMSDLAASLHGPRLKRR